MKYKYKLGYDDYDGFVIVNKKGDSKTLFDTIEEAIDFKEDFENLSLIENNDTWVLRKYGLKRCSVLVDI